ILAAVTATAVALYFLARGTSLAPYKQLFLMGGSTAFVLIAVLAGSFKSWYGRLLFLALVFFWHGDLLGPTNFYTGVWAFLLGHLVLLAAFTVRGLSLRRVLVTAAALAPVSLGACVWICPHVPPSGLPLVLAYIIVISIMLALAGGSIDSPGRTLVITAAVIFYVSDIFVARWRFVTDSSYNAFFCYPLYYTACILFAYSAALERDE
ncbi:MAG: lysoplasmalogenase, partial [bacterium]|nr:lysoplasmalogenase [bacterium]